MIAVVWQPDALQDLDEAFHWYEGQRPGLGAEFALEIDNLLTVLQRFPNARTIAFWDLRRALVPRFPFGLYYLVEEQRVVIIGLLHLKRDVQKVLSSRRRWK